MVSNSPQGQVTADTVDGFHAYGSPVPSALYALNSNRKFPSSIVGSYPISNTYGTLAGSVDISASNITHGSFSNLSERVGSLSVTKVSYGTVNTNVRIGAANIIYGSFLNLSERVGSLSAIKISYGTLGSSVKIGVSNLVNQGGTARVLHGNAAGNPSWGAVVTNDITDANVTYIKIQEVSATDKVLGRSTAGAGVVEEIPCTAVGRSIIDDATLGTVRTTLGLVAGGTGDIWVEKAGDIMTGNIQFSGAQSIIGGTLTTSDLTLQTTTTVGTLGADMHFKVGNNGATEAMTILNNGNVGIRTGIPQRILQINDQVATGIVTALKFAKPVTVNDGTGGIEIDFVLSESLDGDPSACIKALRTAAGAYGDLTFNTTGVAGTNYERIRITNAGFVGIGTVSPQAALHVKGGAIIGAAANPGVNNLYVVGSVSASAVVDRTPYYTGDALTELKAVKGTYITKGSLRQSHIDHRSLPLFAQAKGTISGRDLGAMVSILTKAVQQLTEKVEILEKK